MELLSFINNIGPFPALCFALGILLIIVEMFHPGFGAPGIGGTLLLILGVVFTAKTITEALIMIIIILTILGVLLALVLQSATKGGLSKRLVLFDVQKKESGYIGTDDLNYLLGKEGTTVTALRPAGTADFNGVKMDVVSQGEFIPLGAKVKIIEVQGRRIVAKEIIHQ